MKASPPIKLSSLLAALKAEPLITVKERNITSCYISDLLSDVLARAQPGVLWLTIQAHRNVVSCAATKDIGAVLITCGRKPEREVLAEAAENDVILLSTPLTTYKAAGKLWEAGIR